MGIIHDRNVKGGKARPKILTNFGINNYYRYYKKNRGLLERKEYVAVVRACNGALIDEILQDAEEYTLPYGMGRISFRKRKNRAVMNKDKIYSTALINWKKTMELWEKDLHARNNRIKVRYNNMHTGRYSFRIGMFGRTFKNKEYFAFRFKRSFKRAFAKRIKTYNLRKIEAQVIKSI